MDGQSGESDKLKIFESVNMGEIIEKSLGKFTISIA
jgi:hypothetical protein